MRVAVLGTGIMGAATAKSIARAAVELPAPLRRAASISRPPTTTRTALQTRTSTGPATAIDVHTRSQGQRRRPDQSCRRRKRRTMS
jgi:3-hydroxyacyl-CoA dehydrogenase